MRKFAIVAATCLATVAGTLAALLTTLTDMTSIFAAMKKVEDFVGESIPVVSAEDHLKLVGVIPEGNIFKAYSDAIGEIREEEYGDS